MQKIKTAIIGTGKVAHIFAAALKSLPESDFIAVTSRTPDDLPDFMRGIFAALAEPAASRA